MAIKMDKTRSSGGLAERGKFQVMCPISGRQSIFGSEDLVSLDALSDSSEETDQVPNSPLGRRLERHTSLGAIIEDVDDDGVQSIVSSKKSLVLNEHEGINLGQNFHRHSSRSFAPEKSARRSDSPEQGSMRSMSQASSTAGIEVRMSGADSRCGNEHDRKSRVSKSRRPSDQSKKPARKKQLPRKVHDNVHTAPPPYDPELLRRFAPRVRASWAIVLKRVSWEVLGRRLYETIFDEAPSLEPMFGRSAVTMGIKMVDMIDSMVTALDDPPAVHRKMEGLGAVHHRHGVRALEHMPVFQGVVVRLLRGALLEEFTGEVAEAWGWLWGWLTESMLVVENASHAKASLIQRSWDAVNDALTVEQIGGAVYDTLFQIAPNLKSLFTKPKEIMAVKLVNIVGLLVSVSASPGAMDALMREAGVRHVVYGVASHHVTVMCKAILSTLETALGDQWTPEVARAWAELWDGASSTMATAIDQAEEQGAAMECLWKRVQPKLGRNRFAIQVYNRLTNASPELVLVFMHAGQGTRVVKQVATDARRASALSEISFLRATSSADSLQRPQPGGKDFAESGRDAKISGARFGSSNGAESSAPSIGTLSSRPSSSGTKQLEQKQKDHDKKSKFASILDSIERVTGFDLDGDGTVAGDVLFEDEDLDIPGHSKAGSKTRFSRTTWGLEIWELLNMSMSLLYEPELQVLYQINVVLLPVRCQMMFYSS